MSAADHTVTRRATVPAANTNPNPGGNTGPTGATYRREILIERFVPITLNRSVGRHWSKLAKIKRQTADLITVSAANVRKVSDQYRPVRRLAFEVRCARVGRLPDPDNVLKAMLDALKTARIIVDDSSAWVVWSMPTIVRAKKGEVPCTVITIEDVPNVEG